MAAPIGKILWQGTVTVDGLHIEARVAYIPADPSQPATPEKIAVESKQIDALGQPAWVDMPIDAGVAKEVMLGALVGLGALGGLGQK